MNRLLIIVLVLCWPYTVEAGTNLLRGCRNCNLRVVAKAEASSETVQLAADIRKEPMARSAVSARPRMICEGGRCFNRARRTRAVAVTRRPILWPRRVIMRSRIRS